MFATVRSSGTKSRHSVIRRYFSYSALRGCSAVRAPRLRIAVEMDDARVATHRLYFRQRQRDRGQVAGAALGKKRKASRFARSELHVPIPIALVAVDFLESHRRRPVPIAF